MSPMIIDAFLPDTSRRVAVHRIVKADPATTFAAITTANVAADPAVRALFAVRELPNRLVTRLREGTWPESTLRSFTFGDMDDVPSWKLLGEEPGLERVAGAIGRFWERGYGWREDVVPSDFAAFAEPGYAKTAVGFSVQPYGDSTLFTYESRTTTTDAEAAQKFARYWLLLRFFVPLVMGRAVDAIAAEAESRAAAQDVESEVVAV